MVHSAAPIPGLAGEFLAIADRVDVATEPDKSLADLAALAVTAIPFCDWASITQVGTGGHFFPVAATHPVAEAADHAQHDLDQGPCADASHGHGLYWAADLTTSSDWPQFSARAVTATPVRSAMAVTLTADPHPTVLNLYSATAGGFSVDTVDRASDFAGQSQMLLKYTDRASKIAHLDRALTTSRVIGTAIGILMYAHRITSDDAFARLIRASQNQNRKLVDIASDIARTGALPPGPRRRVQPPG